MKPMVIIRTKGWSLYALEEKNKDELKNKDDVIIGVVQKVNDFYELCLSNIVDIDLCCAFNLIHDLFGTEKTISLFNDIQATLENEALTVEILLHRYKMLGERCFSEN